MGDTVMDGRWSCKSAVGPTMPSESLVDRPKEQVISNGDRLILKWTQVHGIGAGLQNMGNTCFINSALQCLTYTPPLANYLMSGEHCKTCHVSGFCMMCSMENHISEVFSNSGKVLKTVGVVNELHRISNNFNIGEEGDAHEFLRYTIDAMQTSCLPGTKLDKQGQKTTFIDQVFGGYLRSRVECLDCKADVDRFEPYLDITLAIQKASSLSKALREFVKPDVLDGDNAYSCSKCQKKVTALKGYTFHQNANVLTFILKRFDSIIGRKLKKDFKYPEYLDMRPFMSQTQGENQLYSLYAVMVHSGYSGHTGHYYCYIKWSDGKWYQMNDATVSVSDIRTVLNQQAYLLFYIKSSDGEKTADCSPMNHHPDLPGQSPEHPVVKPLITKTIPHNNTGFRIPKLPKHMTKDTIYVTGKGSLRDSPKSSQPSTTNNVGKPNHGLASSSSISQPISRPKVISDLNMLQKLSSLISQSKPYPPSSSSSSSVVFEKSPQATKRDYRDRRHRLQSDNLSPHDRDYRDRDSARRYEQTVHHPRESYHDRSPHHYPRHRSRDDRDFEPRGNCRKKRDEQQKPDSRVTKSYSRERNSYPSLEETSVPATVSDGSVAEYEGSPGLPPHFMSILAPNREYLYPKRAADNLIRETNDSPEAFQSKNHKKKKRKNRR